MFLFRSFSEAAKKVLTGSLFSQRDLVQPAEVKLRQDKGTIFTDVAPGGAEVVGSEV